MLGKKRIFLVCFAAFLLLSLLTSASAVTIIESDPANTTARTFNCRIGRYRVELSPFPPAYWNIFDGNEAQVLQNAFPGWTFRVGGWDPGGTMNVRQYDAARGLPWDPQAYFRVEYAGGTVPAASWVWGWIQFVNTNRPRPGAPANTPYVDPQPNDDNMPFYHSLNEIDNNQYLGERIYNPAVGVDIQFLDRPSRGLADAPVSWKAHLFLVAWDNDATDGEVWVPSLGLEWGFTITRIGAGNAGAGNFDRAGVAGDKLDEYLSNPSDYGYEESGVGGVVIGVNKLELLAPYVGLASIVALASITTAIYVKRVRRREEKQ